MRARLRIVVACNEVRIRLSYLHGFVALFPILLWLTPTANATPITYTEMAISCGSLGGSDFCDKLVTITVTGDTANSGAAFQTNLGSFILNSVSGDSTFTAETAKLPPADDLKYHPDIRTPGEIAKQPQRW